MKEGENQTSLDHFNLNFILPYNMNIYSVEARYNKGPFF